MHIAGGAGAVAASGVTVKAAVGAGAVGADVEAFGTAAGRTLSFVFAERERPAGEAGYPLRIDTAAVNDTCRFEVNGFGARFQPQPENGSSFGQCRSGFLYLSGGRLPNAGGGQPFADAGVNIQKTDNAGVAAAVKRFGISGKAAAVFFRCPCIVKQNRVVAPDHLIAADLPRQPPEAAANLLFRRQSRFDLRPVGRQCKLKIKTESPFFYHIQFFEKRFRRIFRPKYNRLNPPGRQLYPRNLPAVHRIAHADKPFLQPVEKPFAVKCRNIRPPRHTENHSPIIARRRGEDKEGESERIRKIFCSDKHLLYMLNFLQYCRYRIMLILIDISFSSIL